VDLPKAHLTWVKGGHAEIVRVEGDTLTLRSTIPTPPGARVEALLTDEPQTKVMLKSHGTRRDADGSFSLTARLIDANRALRDRLARVALRPPDALTE
jgi:hypothetical protein